MRPSTLCSVRVSHGLLTCLLVASTASGQALVTGDLATSAGQAIAARSTLAWSTSLTRGSPSSLDAGLDGAGWMGAGETGPLGRTGYTSASLRIGAGGRGGTGGAWLRVGGGGLWDGTGAHSLLLTGVGALLTRGPVAIELSLTEARVTAVTRTVTLASAAVPIDTPGVPPPGPTTVRELVGGGVWGDVRAQLTWSGGPIEGKLTGGAEIKEGGGRPVRWLRTEATAWLSRRVGVVVGAGSQSLPLLEAPPPTGSLTVALRVAFGRPRRPAVAPVSPPPAGQSFEVHSLTGNLRSLRVHVPHAERVELTADFLDWRVITLTPAGPGVWEAELTIGPGNHRVSIRVDGGPWVAPPGLPPIADDFSAAAGLLRVD